MKKPIVTTWGIGDTYRSRIKSNIETCLKSGYDNTMDYVILTDVPSDFDELRRTTNKIVDVVNIHEVREEYAWSKDIEHIPQKQETYGDEYRANISQDKQFSYSLHRFSLPKIAELGYTNFLMHDPDADIRYDKIVSGEITEEEFWEQFNTPVRSMKGCYKEAIQVSSEKFEWARAVGLHQSMVALQTASLLVEKLNTKYKTNKCPIVPRLEITEGPFRYYNFSSTTELKEYFDVWNDAIKLSFSDTYLRRTNFCGGYMLCDYIPIGAANLYYDMKVLDFSTKYYTIDLYWTDRYFMPREAGLPDGMKFQPGSTLDDFMEKNKHVIEALKAIGRWPKH
jgi:hypothetical protein